MKKGLVGLSVLAGLLFSGVTFADVTERQVDIYSDGTRIRGTVFQPASPNGGKLPALVLAHGWGGTAARLRPQAEKFALAGFFTLVIDYRGWGESDARWINDISATGEQTRRELRETVDPIDQATDISNAVHWIMGEPAVDASRVGLWGTSFSGGLIVHVAARDSRIRAIVSQVAWFGESRIGAAKDAFTTSRAIATRRARGEIGFPPPGARIIGNLRGGPISEKFLQYAPIDDVAAMHSALLVIDAEKEELFDTRAHGAAVFERAKEPKRRVVIPGIAHYGIYSEAREQATELAVEWFKQHLQ
ncbi:MAG: alpha/beta hydrolase [Burkholderiales bacterium]